MQLSFIQYKKRVLNAFNGLFGFYTDNLEPYILDDFLEEEYYNQEISPKEAARLIGETAGLVLTKLMK